MNSLSAPILLIVSDPIGENMAGPGIRFWEFARILSHYRPVILAVPPLISVSVSGEPPQPDFPAEVVICRTQAELQAVVSRSAMIVTLGGILAQYPFLAETGKPLVLDLYDPFLLAGLHKFKDRPLPERINLHEGYRRTHVFQIRAADFMICASEKQRDYWLGMLAVLGRLNPFTNDADPTLRQLIDVVPFGLPSHPPQHTRSVLKGVYQNISAQDKVILWGGGIWNWFDAPTLIRAVSQIVPHRPEVKIFFMGVKRPNLSVPKMELVDRVIGLSQELGLYNQHVFFADWTPYNERQNFLLEADIGASLHLNHAEAHLSFRTRLLDYFWAGLPILATEGDVLSDLVAEWDLGEVVKPEDVEGVAEAILKLLDIPRESYRSRFIHLIESYQWQKVAQPLVQFCLNPYLAPDKEYLKTIPTFDTISTPWWALPQKSWQTIKQQGFGHFSDKAKEYLKWKFR